jgi:hypothetical protein
VDYGDASIRGVLKLPNDAPLSANAKFFVSLKRLASLLDSLINQVPAARQKWTLAVSS